MGSTGPGPAPERWRPRQPNRAMPVQDEILHGHMRARYPHSREGVRKKRRISSLASIIILRRPLSRRLPGERREPAEPAMVNTGCWGRTGLGSSGAGANRAVREGCRAGDRRASWAISERRDGPRFRLHWWLSILAELVRFVPDGLLTGGR